MVVVMGVDQVDADTQISIEVYGIKLPAYTNVATTFAVYHYSAENDRVVAGDQLLSPIQ
jgi:hypothetical protein